MTERMTWEQIGQALEAGWTRAIIAVGAMEQHGPHMATATDTLLGYEMARRLARRLGKTLVAPAISVGYSQGQMSHPGTISISEETLKTLMLEYCQSLAAHGFKEIILLPSHGGNIRPIGEALPELRAKIPGVRIVGTETDPGALIKSLDNICQRLSLDIKAIGYHAGQGETSQMLVIHPDLVDMSKAVEGFTGDISVRWRSKVVPPMATMSPTGILGDARGSTAEIGERLFEARLDDIEEWVRRELSDS